MLLDSFLTHINNVLGEMAEAILSKPADTKPAPAPQESCDTKRTSDIVINGVKVPKLVAEQLQKLGLSLTSYSAHELESAVRSCAIDCTLIDDHDATDFYDALELSEEESHSQAGRHNPHTKHSPHPELQSHEHDAHDNSFCSRIKRERDLKAQQLTDPDSHEESMLLHRST